MDNDAVYLGGTSDSWWKEEFKSQISTDIKIIDPIIVDYDKISTMQKVENIAQKLSHIMSSCEIAVFYLDQNYSHSTLLEIGECVGRNKQTIVCMTVDDFEIKSYCEFHGIVTVNSLSDLIVATEEMVAQFNICV